MKLKRLFLTVIAVIVGLVGGSLGVFSLIGLMEVFQRKLTGGGPIGKANVVYPLLLVVSVFALRFAWELIHKAKALR